MNDFSMHEDGIGMARTFEMEFNGRAASATGPQAGLLRGRRRAAEPRRLHRLARTCLRHRQRRRADAQRRDATRRSASSPASSVHASSRLSSTICNDRMCG